MSSASQWYVIHTHGKHETKVEVYLGKKGLNIFLPRMTMVSRRRDRKKYLQVPLFPGYVFVHTDLSQESYHHIVKSPGVVRILGNQREYFPVAPEVIESIRLMVASQRAYYPWEHLEKGRRVRIVEGPLTGAVGVVERVKDNKRRLIVAVEILGRSVAVDLENEAVEPVGS